LQWFAAQIDARLGLSLKAGELESWQIGLRAIIVYGALIVCVRFGKKRFLGQATAFDAILVIIIGSTASRAITGTARFAGALVAAFALVGVHWIFSFISRSSPAFGHLIKGRTTLIIKSGQVVCQALRDEHMSKDDLDEDLRKAGFGSSARISEAAGTRRNAVGGKELNFAI
jgi:uncharacterized membrane protein YcaP (DUF421 family)